MYTRNDCVYDKTGLANNKMHADTAAAMTCRYADNADNTCRWHNDIMHLIHSIKCEGLALIKIDISKSQIRGHNPST